MTTIEERLEAVEQGLDKGRKEHLAIAKTLEDLHEGQKRLETNTSTNGGVSAMVKDKRIKFTGSMPTAFVPWLFRLGLIGVGAGGAGAWIGLW